MKLSVCFFFLGYNKREGGRRMKTYSLKQIIPSILFTVFLIFNTLVASAESTVPDKFDILIINSYDRSNVWTTTEEKGIEEGLASVAGRINLYHEYMDSKRIHGTSFEASFSKYISDKYKDVSIDLIVTTDDYATNFVKNHKTEFAKLEIPVVFSGLNDLSFNEPYFVGVYEKVDITGTVELIKSVHGEETPVLLVTDKTISSDSIIKTSLNDQTWRTKENVTLLQENNTGKIREVVSNFKEGAVLFLLFNEDSNGNTYSYFDGLSEIKKSTDLPVYVVWDFYLGQQVLGGSLITKEQMGEDVSHLINRMVNGEDYTMLSSITTEAQKVLDYEMLKKYGIDVKDMQNKAEVVNMPESFWDQYSQLITLVFSLTAIFVLIIVLLINNIRQKNKYYGVVGEYKNEMITANQKLEKKLADHSQLIEQLTEENALLITKLMEFRKRASFAEKFPVVLHEISTVLSTLHGTLSFLQTQNDRIGRNETGLTHEEQLIELRELTDETAVHSDMKIQEIIHLISAIRTCIGDLSTTGKRSYKLHAYVEAFWVMIRPTIKKKKVSLMIKIPEDVYLYGNPGDFLSILAILIGNSLRHGYVLSPERELKIEIEAYSNEHTTHFIYRDDGNGCPTEKLENAMKLKLDINRISQGGVGLFQLHKMVTEELLGQISISGDIDEGVRVRITLPKAGEQQ